MNRETVVKKSEPGRISRRIFAMASMAAGGDALSRTLFAAEDGIVPTMVNAAKTAKIEIRPIRRNITVLDGSGGNIAVLTGRDGKLLIDSGFAVSRTQISKALATLGSDPIRHLINTHWHTDHTDGNEWMHEAGAAIVAHENTRKRLSVATRVEGWDFTFPPAPSGALPATVFDHQCEVRLNDTHLLMKYYGPAHTDSDISVYFAEADVLHTCDTLWNGYYPFIDYSTGGSIDGSIRAAEANLAAVTNKTIIIPGHGPVGGKSDLTEFRDMLVSIRANVATLKKQGRSLEETIGAKPTADFDAKWGNFLMTPALFTGLVYAGV
jgi:glyoxylase-like metal-dependent hydrolase (beta-lactamase superfamily II)